MGKTLTFGQVDKYSNQLAGYLQSRGLQKGEKVAVMIPNLLKYPIASFCILRAGLVAVNTNPLYTPGKLKFDVSNDNDPLGSSHVEYCDSNPWQQAYAPTLDTKFRTEKITN